MTLYLFNPEHDYAWANNDPHFMAPASATKFADDCAEFLRYLAEDEEFCIFRPYSNQPLANPQAIQRVVPWGWDRLMHHQLSTAGINPAALPSVSQLEQWRDLAHRKISIAGMRFLQAHCPTLSLPHAATLLTTPEEVESFIAEHRNVILKSPYSGNGRGNLYAHGEYSDTLRRQTTGVIRRQGSLLGEQLHQVVQDFAMEFQCHNGAVVFSGYSLFQTKHYGYAGNLLISDKEIVSRLGQWVPTETLQQIQEALIEFLRQTIAPHYDGYLGVDMYIYEQDGEFLLNPMVEINLRMTMGMAAHIVYERYVHPEVQGLMQITYMPKPGELLTYSQSKAEMQFCDNRWRAGFLSLTPIYESTQYAITVEVQ